MELWKQNSSGDTVSAEQEKRKRERRNRGVWEGRQERFLGASQGDLGQRKPLAGLAT